MSDDTTHDDTSSTGRDGVVGKVQEKVGWLTGDREAEAKGKVRQQGGEADDDGTVAKAEDELRQDYEEYDPAVDGAPVAEDVTPADTDPRTG